MGAVCAGPNHGALDCRKPLTVCAGIEGDLQLNSEWLAAHGAGDDLPITAKDFGSGVNVDLTLIWAHAEMQGWRESMEDAHLALHSLGKAVSSDERAGFQPDKGWDAIALFGVMDGHGGFQVAKFCERHLPAAIARRSSQDPADALTEAFLEMDEMLEEQEGLAELQRLSIPPNPSFLETLTNLRVDASTIGCTAVVCCISSSTITVANAGDSRAVLSRGGAALDLSQDHKPDLQSERERIIEAGGWVEIDGYPGDPRPIHRVNGDLSLSRAIGDLEFKRNENLRPDEQIVSCVPEVHSVRRQSNDEFLLLACDGVWDVMESQEAVNFVSGHLGPRNSWSSRLVSGELVLSDILSKLLDRCLSPNLDQTEGYGGDNMTAILVLFASSANGSPQLQSTGPSPSMSTTASSPMSPAVSPLVASPANLPPALAGQSVQFLGRHGRRV
eukprot:TRINITY_DN94752_c0_g1_i1.p1 TRINITY_DN94752_c0_g1~~TRINITY_DN94752_c0_g1_i1.p1  ORF type:complete len:444 (-),score=59.06 TRINITY_DN94752_c0_g1_i1:244-1575(-)